MTGSRVVDSAIGALSAVVGQVPALTLNGDILGGGETLKLEARGEPRRVTEPEQRERKIQSVVLILSEGFGGRRREKKKKRLQLFPGPRPGPTKVPLAGVRT